tara:strand:- start:98 stop:1042 length:945 start_codon:yes stop_codon:yes gene_type:complete
MGHFYLILILASFSLSYFSIRDDKVYDAKNNQLYNSESFISLLNQDSDFYNNQNFKIYIKSHKNLQFKKNWWTHLILIGSWGAGLEGINHPERWEEGGDNYNLGDDNSPPGIDNIIIGSVFYVSYYKYNQIRKERSLYKLIQDYNHFYFQKDREQNPPYSFVDNVGNIDYWKLSASVGASTEKVGASTLDISLDFKITNKDYFYFSYGNFLILGQGIGAGYKHYLKSRYNHSSFLGISFSGSMIGDGNSMPRTGKSCNLALGQSIKILNRARESLFVNIGLVVSYTNIRFYENSGLGKKYSLEILPLINLETRF